MLKPRLIPVLLYKDGVLVRSKGFNFFQATGDPVNQVQRFTDWKADELIYLDISRGGPPSSFDNMSVIGSTSSQRNLEATLTDNFIEVIRCVAEKCMIPLTVGGKIRSLDDIRIRLNQGADKVSVNTQALDDPSFITRAAKEFGDQCIVVSVDTRYNKETGKHEVFSNFGKKATHRDAVEWCREAEKMGAGEILLGSIDRDGMGKGYDLDLIQKVSDAVNIPVIALGGVGTYGHIVEGLTKGKATAVAAANIFHFTEQSIINAKKFMKASGITVRL